MTSRSFVVEVAGPCENVDSEILQDVLKQQIRSYLKRRGSSITDCDLSLRIERCGVETHTSRVSLKLRFEGTINGKSIRRVFKLNRGVGSGASAVGIATIVANSAVARIASGGGGPNPFGSGAAGKQLCQCIDECVASIELELDGNLGISESPDGLRWKKIEWLSWIVPVVAILANIVVFPRDLTIDAGLFFAVAVFYGVPLYFAVRCIGYLIMPEEFFRTDPRGRKAMSLSGVQSMIGLRVVALILAVILIAVAGGAMAFIQLEPSTNSKRNAAAGAEAVGEQGDISINRF